MDFRSVISEFTGSSKIGYYLIHLPRATERKPLIEELNHKLNITLPIFDAAVGTELIRDGHPTRCGHSTKKEATRSPGDIGCTVSHLRVAQNGLQNNYDYVVVFEDDCVMNSDLESLRSSLASSDGIKWDLFLLGATAYRKHMPLNSKFSQVKWFEGTHCLIMNKNFMEHLVQVYTAAYDAGTVYAADGLYDIVCQTRDVKCIGFRNPASHFEQKHGLYSYIIDRIRHH